MGKMPDKINLNELDRILDDHGVEWMLYDTVQDAGLIRIFSNHPGWEQVSEDYETVLFKRSNRLSSEG